VRARAKVTIGSLYEVIYEKLIGTKMNDLNGVAKGGLEPPLTWQKILLVF